MFWLEFQRSRVKNLNPEVFGIWTRGRICSGRVSGEKRRLAVLLDVPISSPSSTLYSPIPHPLNHLSPIPNHLQPHPQPSKAPSSTLYSPILPTLYSPIPTAPSHLPVSPIPTIYSPQPPQPSSSNSSPIPNLLSPSQPSLQPHPSNPQPSLSPILKPTAPPSTIPHPQKLKTRKIQQPRNSPILKNHSYPKPYSPSTPTFFSPNFPRGCCSLTGSALVNSALGLAEFSLRLLCLSPPSALCFPWNPGDSGVQLLCATSSAQHPG
ncbi:hypothetical protein Baya_14331 [Bagarius yarrelli]|uniref:Uncharacterized protein n=1 Tax=Bagarius yarrelli TaxID=175774 RepID=A0A556V8W6_BAGYA|nr:hypothetical protein Baya_14331 [Bagarius yarrelli]